MASDDSVPADRARSGAAPAGAASAGALLREAREAAGVHLAALAVSLKVPAARLQALEDGRLSEMPDLAFARALAASVCRSLRVDPEPVLRQLPRTGGTSLRSDASTVKAPFKPQPQRSARSRFGNFPRPLALAAAALVLGALILVFLPDRSGSISGNSADNSGTSDAAPPGSRPGEMVESAAAPAPSQTAARQAAPAAKGSPLPTPAPARAASAVAAASELATAAASVVPVPPASAVAAAAAAPDASDILVFQTQTEAWLQVTDAKGAALVRRTVPAGETIGVSGPLPMRVTLGRADVTRVTVRGEPLDLAPMTKGTVARFEVK